MSKHTCSCGNPLVSAEAICERCDAEATRFSVHTPGPWRANASWIEGPAMALRVASVDWPSSTPGSAPREVGEAKANARLIAAAPELLSLAKRWIALDGGSWNVERHASERFTLRNETRDLIAKAEGGAA